MVTSTCKIAVGGTTHSEMPLKQIILPINNIFWVTRPYCGSVLSLMQIKFFFRWPFFYDDYWDDNDIQTSKIYRGYYTVAWRYEFNFRVAKQYFTNERSEWVKYCFCHEKIKFISLSRRVMFFLLYRQNDIDKIIEGDYQNYVIDKLTCEIMENKPLGSQM